MKRAPVRWGSGRWDIGSKANMGVDSIPTLYDANISGYLLTEYQSGVGYGNQLYLRNLIESQPGDPYPQGNVPSGYIWAPEIQGGYLYIGRDEYYLFANKITASGFPDVSGILELGLYDDKYPSLGAPIIVTSGVSEFTPEEPWGKTYEPAPSGATPSGATSKYRKVVDLSDRKEWTLDASGHVIPYSFTLGDMQFTIAASGNHPTVPSGWHRYIDCTPSGHGITVEMEGGPSGYLQIDGVDFNRLNTYETHNTFLVVSPSGEIVPSGIEVNYISRYMIEAAQRIHLIAAVKDRWGAPISGIQVAWAASVGTLDNAAAHTYWDGTVSNWCTIPSVTSAGTTITVTVNDITDRVWVPHGKVS